jgi:hypothetical protein
MKHLKKFNEGLQLDEVNELKDFCETSLAYLIDEGFEVSCRDESSTNFVGKRQTQEDLIMITLYLPNVPRLKQFDWNDVKDYYIPFLQLLSRRYELCNWNDLGNEKYDVCFQGGGSYRFATIDQVVNDDLLVTKNFITSSLWSIKIQVKGKI